MRHLVTFSVEGRPASFATSHELAWKKAVAAAVAAHVPTSWPRERFSVRVEFRTNPSVGAGEVWDLDNLIKPTPDAMAGVFGTRAWRGVPQPADDRVDHINAHKRVAQPGELPGAVIEVWAMEDDVGAPTFHREDLAARGFLGFVPLLALDPKAVPKQAGVYAVLREMDARPEFLEANPVGRFKGEGSHHRSGRPEVDLGRGCPLHLHREGKQDRDDRPPTATDGLQGLRPRPPRRPSRWPLHLATRRRERVHRLLDGDTR
jgi:hypothetical protein